MLTKIEKAIMQGILGQESPYFVLDELSGIKDEKFWELITNYDTAKHALKCYILD